MEKTLARNAFYNVLYTAQNVLFPVITAAYLARVLNPEGVGAVSYARNIVSYFTMFTLLGLPQHGMREIARGKENRDRLFSELLILGAAIGAICAAGYFGLIRWLHPGDRVYLVLGLEVLFQLVNIAWLFQGEADFAFITRRSISEKLITLVLIFLFVRGRQDLANYCLISCLGKGWGYLWNLLRARKYAKLTLQNLNVHRHLAPVLTLMLGSMAASLYSKVDITMLGWLTDAASVGFYTNAHKVVNIVIALSVAVSGVFLPRLSREYGTDPAGFRESVSLGLKIVLLLALPCCAGLMLVAEGITEVLFGPAFAQAAAAIRILSPLVLVKGAGDMLCYQTLLSAGRERKLIPAYLLAGAANIALNFVLIPRFGHNGAAAASVISELVVNGILLKTALAVVQPKLGRRFCCAVLVGTAAMVLAVLAVQQWAAAGLLPLAASIAAGALAYIGTVLPILTAGKGESIHEHANR